MQNVMNHSKVTILAVGRAGGLLVSIFTTLVAVSGGETFRFVDVSATSGLQEFQGHHLKFGGGVVADLDGDGFSDLLLGHHDDQPAQIFYNNRNGTFRLGKWWPIFDTHGLNPFRASPLDTSLHFSLSQGGANGNKPSPPIIFTVGTNLSIGRSQYSSDVMYASGRGRSAVFLNLHRESHAFTDVLFTNAPIKNSSKSSQVAFQGNHELRFVKRKLQGLEKDSNPFGTVTDMDGDGRVELLMFPHLTIFTVVDNFHLRDISLDVFPANMSRSAVVAIAELDFDNDGQWDLYIARSTTGHLSWLEKEGHNDYLLRNVGGRYIDVSDIAGIPRDVQTRGVTVADFDNDGFVDVLLVQYTGGDMLLHNRGDGTFSQVDPGFGRDVNVHGDMASAIDYNRDGRMDVLLSEGDWFDRSFGGSYRLLMNDGALGNYLLVRVGSSPALTATSLHGVVTVRFQERSCMRRVGSPGTAVSAPLIELLHFGLGDSRVVERVSVTWTDGFVASQFNVTAGSLLVFGRF